MAEVAIVASAFGVEAIRRDGHAAWIVAAAQSGAAAFEVRRELMDDASPATLHALGAAIAGAGLWPVWSTPDTLYDARGTLDEAALRDAVDCGRLLGARFVKLQLGGFSGDPQVERLNAVLAETGEAESPLRVVVENGQLEAGGSLAQFVALFGVLRETAGSRTPIGMTFDIGNWQWPGEPPLLAAAALAPYVEYIHCKAVAGEGARRYAIAPVADDPLCRAALALLPPHVPRGIEFPFDPACAGADAAHYVAWLAGA
ncbi:sugar phosphate isomerase/epimerase [Paraburkholderia sp. J12]|uniref:sugar phosphate isomerase/epimerase n=1 Tax=Paraburkholderia sp. J12 TaxID=2805432 RepID=UPI002ABE8344|nr:sugar phosphate isomerase/epimerase [Paraburkholderia sp. J12]